VEGDQNCAQSEGGVGEESHQRLESSAQAGASVSYSGRNLGPIYNSDNFGLLCIGMLTAYI